MHLGNMCGKMFFPAEPRVTNLTLEWPHVAVSHDVKFEFVKSVKLFVAASVITKWTFELFLFRVNENVSLQFILPVELGITDIALIWQFSTVNEHVRLQVGFILHFLFTNFAFEHCLGVSDC